MKPGVIRNLIFHSKFYRNKILKSEVSSINKKSDSLKIELGENKEFNKYSFNKS